LNLLGGTLGATGAFLVARHTGADWVAVKTGGRLKRIIAGVEAEGWRFVALTRLVPIVPFNILNYALGLTRIRLSHYVLATLICMVPGAAAYSWLGYAGRVALQGDSVALNYGLLGLAILALVAFLPPWIRRLSEQSEAWISVSELKDRLSESASPAIIDVRGPEEFNGPLGHIPEAINLPMSEFESRLSEVAASDGQPIVLVCKTDKRSEKAATILRSSGIRHVMVLRGGMEEWSRHGEPSQPIATPI
jgi:rhodanese-related sulfurtransferase